MRTILYILAISLLLISNQAKAQLDVSYNKKFCFKDYCFDGRIKTILLHKESGELSEPVLELGSTDVLSIRFDDLSESMRSLYYVVIHCDADWNEDGTFSADYMRGFRENRLNHYAYSINTQVPYLHYSFTLPNKELTILASGNYLLKVYDYANPEVPLFQKGFCVVERKVGVKASSENLALKGQPKDQQLNFSISYASLWVQDPFRDLKVRIEQNSHRVPGVTPPLPKYMADKTADYSQSNANIYKGGNEFRMFDIRTLDYAAQGVTLIDKQQQKQVHVLLNDALPRANKPYSYSRDLNGRYYVDVDRKLSDKNLEADYIEVYFTLPADEPYAGTNIYVYGQLSDWSIYNSHAMVYSHERKAYELTLQLKQGYYSYMLVAVDAKGSFNPSLIEGDFGETENGYTIYVYYRSVRDRWDRLVGVESINTLKVGNTPGLLY